MAYAVVLMDDPGELYDDKGNIIIEKLPVKIRNIYDNSYSSCFLRIEYTPTSTSKTMVSFSTIKPGSKFW